MTGDAHTAVSGVVGPSRSALFPVFLKLAGRKVAVVGGGPVALQKIRALLEAGACVTVIAPRIVPAIAALDVVLQGRRFAPVDLDGVWYVVAAAPPEVNREVRRAADERRIFVNAVDDPETATAYAGAVLRKGGVTVAVSTSGHAPALAGLVRDGLDSILPDEIAEWAAEARWQRAVWKSQTVPMAERRPRLLEALNRRYAAVEPLTGNSEYPLSRSASPNGGG
ncbi:MAG: bifunctional precorrin-2 dehydrogenase/sirohydrochlorin ferrochelatase [Planctomycetes bacterium]|nr:bifunctional precorrin-2 dehydrogenase/sirohydrochlorin ferrochelatase [Planctomycetota bacterium]